MSRNFLWVSTSAVTCRLKMYVRGNRSINFVICQGLKSSCSSYYDLQQENLILFYQILDLKNIHQKYLDQMVLHVSKLDCFPSQYRLTFAPLLSLFALMST